MSLLEKQNGFLTLTLQYLSALPPLPNLNQVSPVHLLLCSRKKSQEGKKAYRAYDHSGAWPSPLTKTWKINRNGISIFGIPYLLERLKCISLLKVLNSNCAKNLLFLFNFNAERHRAKEGPNDILKPKLYVAELGLDSLGILPPSPCCSDEPILGTHKGFFFPTFPDPSLGLNRQSPEQR